MPKKPINPPTESSNKTVTETSAIVANTKLSIHLSWELVGPAYNFALKKLAKRVRSPGFRPGKVPAHIAADIIGPDQIKEEALKGLLPQAYQDLIKESGKVPLTQPEFQAVKVDLNQDWEIEAQIAEKPDVSIKGYEKIAKKAKAEAEKELKANYQHQDKATDATKTDKVEPELSPEEKAKKQEQEKSHHQEHLLQGMFKALILEFKPQIPELLVKLETRGELEQLIKSIEQFGLSFDDYLTRRQLTFEQLSGELATQSLARIQLEFILEAIIEDQKLVASEAEYDEYLNRLTDEKQRQIQRQDQQYMAYITNLIVRKKATQYLLSL